MRFRISLLDAGLIAACLSVLFLSPESAIALATVVTGARATAATQGVLSNTRVIDMSDTIHLLDPNIAPLTAITMKLRKAHAINPKVEWLEDDYVPSSDAADGTVTATATVTITVDNGSYFRAGDVVLIVDTGEIVHVTSVAADILTTTRSIGSEAASIDDNAVLMVIGNANAEGATGRAVKTTQKTPQYNYTQIFRWPYAATGTLMASEIYGGDDFNFQRKKAGLEHRIQMERSFIWGERLEVTSGATPLRFCGGLIDKISTNVTNLDNTGSLTEAVFETFMRTGFRYGPARKLFFCSRLITSFLNLIAGSNIETIPSTSSFPLALTEYVSGHGKLYIITHNLLEGTAGTYQDYGGWGMLLDLDSIFYRYMRERDTHIVTNIQANDEDARKDEYKSECCPMVIQEQNHSVINNVKTYG